jgi:hypothetical protein
MVAAGSWDQIPNPTLDKAKQYVIEIGVNVSIEKIRVSTDYFENIEFTLFKEEHYNPLYFTR